MVRTTKTGRFITAPEPQLRLPAPEPRTPFGIALREKLRKERGEIGDTSKLLDVDYTDIELRIVSRLGFDPKTETAVDWLRRHMGLPKKR